MSSDHKDKDYRLDNSALEFVWHPKQASGIDTPILGVVNYRHYEAPPGFAFDFLNRDEPIMDDPRLEGYNVDRRSNDLVNYFRDMSQHYRSRELAHTFGTDFAFSNAFQN